MNRFERSQACVDDSYLAPASYGTVDEPRSEAKLASASCQPLVIGSIPTYPNLGQITCNLVLTQSSDIRPLLPIKHPHFRILHSRHAWW